MITFIDSENYLFFERCNQGRNRFYRHEVKPQILTNLPTKKNYGFSNELQLSDRLLKARYAIERHLFFEKKNSEIVLICELEFIIILIDLIRLVSVMFTVFLCRYKKHVCKIRPDKLK